MASASTISVDSSGATITWAVESEPSDPIVEIEVTSGSSFLTVSGNTVIVDKNGHEETGEPFSITFTSRTGCTLTNNVTPRSSNDNIEDFDFNVKYSIIRDYKRYPSRGGKVSVSASTIDDDEYDGIAKKSSGYTISQDSYTQSSNSLTLGYVLTESVLNSVKVKPGETGNLRVENLIFWSPTIKGFSGEVLTINIKSNDGCEFYYNSVYDDYPFFFDMAITFPTLGEYKFFGFSDNILSDIVFDHTIEIPNLGIDEELTENIVTELQNFNISIKECESFKIPFNISIYSSYITSQNKNLSGAVTIYTIGNNGFEGEHQTFSYYYEDAPTDKLMETFSGYLEITPELSMNSDSQFRFCVDCSRSVDVDGGAVYLYGGYNVGSGLAKPYCAFDEIWENRDNLLFDIKISGWVN